MQYTMDEYRRAQDTVDCYNARAIKVLKNCGDEKILNWFEECEETFVNPYEKGDGDVRVNVVLWRGYDYEPTHQVFEFPWKLMNTPDEKIHEEYATWREEEDKRLVAKKAAKDKHWAEVREKYRQQQEALK